MKIKKTIYDKENRLINTTISGELDEADIDEWHDSLKEVVRNLEPDTKFKILVNLHGFKAADFNAHKKFRVVIPQTLAQYGWYVGYLRMFPEAQITISSRNNVHCLAAAHVHHDETKIGNYAKNYSMINEGFFTDPEEAKKWIEGITLSY